VSHADTIRRLLAGTLEDPRGEIASALDAMEAENQQLRDALERIADNAEGWHGPEDLPNRFLQALHVIAKDARAALAAVRVEER
jgi:hypothetical protein